MLFHSKLFHYKVDKMSKELNSCLYKLAYGKIDFVIHCSAQFQGPINDIKWGLHCIPLPTTSSEILRIQSYSCKLLDPFALWNTVECSFANILASTHKWIYFISPSKSSEMVVLLVLELIVVFILNILWVVDLCLGTTLYEICISFKNNGYPQWGEMLASWESLEFWVCWGKETLPVPISLSLWTCGSWGKRQAELAPPLSCSLLLFLTFWRTSVSWDN